MNVYSATFISGAQEIIMRQLKKFSLDQIRVTYIDDGLVIFESTFVPERVIDFRFFNNVFLIIEEFDGQPGSRSAVFIRRALESTLPAKREVARLIRGKSVHLIISDQGQPVHDASTQTLQERLTRAYAAAEAARGAALFWLIVRRTGKGALGLRLSRPLYKRVKRAEGTLRPELVNIMGIVGGVKAKDIVLDPFAGHGSIAEECVQGFQVRHVIMVERDQQLVSHLQEKYSTTPRVQIVKGTATNLSMLQDSSVSKIITDPPWGLYDILKPQELQTMYTESLSEMVRVLKPGGIIAMLSGNEGLTSLAKSFAPLELVGSYNILVSGKKAALLKLRKPT